MQGHEILLAACLAFVAVAHLGCGRSGGGDRHGDARGAERPAEPPCACDGAAVVDPTLLAFLSRSRAAHHAADVSLAGGDSAAGVRALEGLVAAPRPAGPPPEVVEVMADTYARLAELRSDAGEFDAAVRDIDAGLALATSPSHYQGHLIEVAGVIEERRAKALEAKGDRAGAAGARQRALGFFERAITVQDQVITEALKDPQEKPR